MTNSATKNAIVTGASGGIGGSVAKRLAKDGFSVVVNYAGKPAPAQTVIADLKAAGDRASLCKRMCQIPQMWSGSSKSRWTHSAGPTWWFTVRASCHYF